MGLCTEGCPQRPLARPGGRVQAKGKRPKQGRGNASATSTAATALVQPAAIAMRCYTGCAVLSLAKPRRAEWGRLASEGENRVRGSFW